MTRVFLIAGEASGDHLGALLMRALREAAPGIEIDGVGGQEMTREGLMSLFPMPDIAVMGLVPVLARLPLLARRLNETVQAILADPPDCLVLIDAPDFTHRVARRVRARAPQIRIVDYVCPSVWAWRPGRAQKMRAYIDQVLAVLPFEPAAMARLDGPPCDYVGHPLIEHLDGLAPRPESERRNGPLLVLPGSREAIVRRMAPIYGAAAALLAADRPGLEIVIPAAPQVEEIIIDSVARWPVRPRIVSQVEKFAAFDRARAALVTSGASTLELALAKVPMVVAYRVAPIESLLRFLVVAEHFALPNLILGRRAVPELFQKEASPQALAGALAPLLDGGPARADQLGAFESLRAEILAGGIRPSVVAAKLVLEQALGRGKAKN